MTDNRLTNDLTTEDVEAAIRHEDRRGRTSHVYKQLLATMRKNELLLQELETAYAQGYHAGWRDCDGKHANKVRVVSEKL